jgi:hypothetical protein
MTLNNGNDVKMKIETNDPRLTGYALGALTPDALQRLEGELDECPASLAFAEELSMTAALLGEALAAEPANALTAEQRAAVAAELSGQASSTPPAVPAVLVQPSRRKVTRKRWRGAPRVRIFSVVMAAAAVLLMVVGLVFVAVRGGAPEQRKQLVDDRPRLHPLTPEGARFGGGPPPRPAQRPAQRPAPSTPASRRVGGSLPSRLTPKTSGKAPGLRLSAEQIRAVLLTATPAVRSCRSKYRGAGLLKVRITIQPTGKVEASVVGAFAGTPMGYCILGAMHTLRFPSFSGAPITFVYPYRLMIGTTKPPAPHTPEQQRALNRAKGLLAKAQNAYVAGNHGRAVKLCKQVLKYIPGHYKAVQILGASSCYLREAKDAQWAYDRVATSYRPLLKKVCLNNGVELR